MKKMRIVIIGAGNRVISTALPVFLKLKELFTIHTIYDICKKTVEAEGEAMDTKAIQDLDAGVLSETDLLYMAVTKESVPKVLNQLSSFDLSETDLLIETPVILFKHFHHADLLNRFRKVWVAEDCVSLPCFDGIHHAVRNGSIGELKEVVFSQSAYKYHGLAALKTLLDCNRITRARRKKIDKEKTCRIVKFKNRAFGRVIEPRDYSKGSFTMQGSKASITDAPTGDEKEMVLEPIPCDDSWQGFKIGALKTFMDEEEMELLGDCPKGGGVVVKMDDMKRIGFFRNMKGIHEGRGAYPLEEALDDMVIDYWLDRIGFYFAFPFMSVKTPMGAKLLKKAMKMVSR